MRGLRLRPASRRPAAIPSPQSLDVPRRLTPRPGHDERDPRAVRVSPGIHGLALDRQQELADAVALDLGLHPGGLEGADGVIESPVHVAKGYVRTPGAVGAKPLPVPRINEPRGRSGG
jgi:hypothetical protein